MLVFDIETTGLQHEHCDVTLVCTHDFVTGKKLQYEFYRARKEAPITLPKMKSDLIEALDKAENLCAFNGIQFDIPFLIGKFQLSEEKKKAWCDKTIDLLEISRYCFKSKFNLDKLCKANNVQTKMASGTDAITWAKQGKFDKLLEYCHDDCRILCDLHKKETIIHPNTLRPWNIKQYLPPYVIEAMNSAGNDSDPEIAMQSNDTAEPCSSRQATRPTRTHPFAKSDDKMSEASNEDNNLRMTQNGDEDTSGSRPPVQVLELKNIMQLAFEFYCSRPYSYPPSMNRFMEVVSDMLDSGRFDLSDDIYKNGVPGWMEDLFWQNVLHATRAQQRIPFKWRRTHNSGGAEYCARIVTK